MNHAQIRRFRFRDWRLDFELTRRGSLVDAKVTASGGAGPLAVRLPAGAKISLEAGKQANFTVDPSQYPVAFGRFHDGAERASIVSRILTGSEPARDPSSMTPAEREAFIGSLEMSYKPTHE
jgi:hypothetical protein